jgi:hypothetical protein
MEETQTRQNDISIEKALIQLVVWVKLRAKLLPCVKKI